MAAAARPSNGWCLYSPPFKASLPSPHAKGMAKNKGIPLAPREEVEDADDLRMAVKEIICDSETGRQEYEEAVIAITVEQSLKRYCQRIRRPDFWGGESEFLVLSRLCRQPIIIYIPEREYHGRGNGFIPIAEYGLEFTKNTKQWKKKTPVRLLYSGRNHYDLLV
ncbi:Cysteine proteinases superfamily protein [Zea mays]|uniref:Ubiquitin thioesterase OTU n=1 Tax=Zea mays TaxID=4577 RepID=A0A1D6JXE2_MAIZE|nr:Cysteine proteinases superfamily protein [Zea mays]